MKRNEMSLNFSYAFRRFIGWLISSLLLCLGLPVHADDLEEESIPPVIIPVSLNEAGEILKKRIRVVDHDVYYFRLRFFFRDRDQADRARVRRLTGGYEVDKFGKALEPGVPTPIQLKVVCIDEGWQSGVVYQKEIDPLLTSWNGSFDKIIGYTELPPGVYDVHVVLQSAAPAFEGTRVAFTIGYDTFKVAFNNPKLDRRTACSP